MYIGFRIRGSDRCQYPIKIPPYRQPEPDIAIARYREDDYLNNHPQPADLLLLIEIADASLDCDRQMKSPPPLPKTIWGICLLPPASVSR
ncbi:hypothetical protein [Geitlerinema sp. PCC 9228]|uniref:hypothetical protein n=1 Tax=Geitlerinema sp. PCC 9228 TaxID=111611 RepID=UPI0008F9CC8B|nr:hypothetical protein [Geitlerinema sp. PCC 9228]